MYFQSLLANSPFTRAKSRLPFLFAIKIGLLLLVAASSQAGIIHRWSFTETSGPVVDSVGGAAGTVVVLGGNSLRTNGFIRLSGGARATSDYVQFPSGLVHGLTNFSIELWATPNAAQNWSRVFDFGPGNDTQANNFFLSFCRGTALNQQRLEFGAPPLWTLDTGLTTATNTKYHYVVTWRAGGGVIAGGNAKWYRNSLLAAATNTGIITISNVDDTVLWLGRSQYPGDNTASADYDEVRIYDYVLSPLQINTNFANGPNLLVLLPPVASNDVMTMNPGAMALINVLQNDQAVGAPLDPASVHIIVAPSAGTAQVQSSGRILYTHNGGPAASDQFTYTVKDAAGSTSQAATVFVTITNALRLPNATITIPNTPPPASYQVVDAFPGLTINQPLALRSLPGTANSNKLFIVERRGYVSYIPDVTAANPARVVLLDITNQVSYDSSATDGERGLLSVEFHPGFATNGYFFVTYTADGGNPYVERLARFTANPANLTVNTNSQLILWSTTKREFNHNGGDLHFGPDGYLYVSMGDEGAQYNFHTNAQRLDASLYAGILRLDVDKRPGNLEPLPPAATIPALTIPVDGSGHAFYSIPADNPFLGVTSLYGRPVDTNHLRGEFYAIGFRHPWRFSIDPMTGEIWVGNVGQDLYESVYILRKGGNYGWPYYEGTNLTSTNYPAQPTMFPPPSGYVLDPPIYEYNHPAVPGSDPSFTGLDVNGSLAYHGARIPQLTNAYIFGDFDLGGSIWALRRTNNTVTVERLTGQYGEAAFGADPVNGDVLMCNYIQNKIQRLVYADTASTFPAKLSDTGVFADLASLTPNPGIVSYEPIISFWSDYAIKRRWFCIPDTTNQMGFATDSNWTFPGGMMWIKHFDLELTRDDPATKKRIETRVLVKTTNGCYGVSYQWNDAGTEAFLVPDGGTNFNVSVLTGSNTITQQWEIPSRSSCLACHTVVAGHALSFNTRELNQATNMNGFAGNQLTLMGQAGYLNTNVTAPQTLPAFASASDSTQSLEYRVRSYLSENCVQCHQPGGSGTQSWDARPWLNLSQTHLINGTPDNNGGNPLNKLIVPGNTNNSVLLQHVTGNGFSRMPPLATHQLDPGAINLLTTWISTDLTNYQSFADWQIAHFGSTNAPNAAASADPDGDGANNYYEYLTKTDPLNASDVWKLGISAGGGFVNVSYPLVPNLGVVIDTGTNPSSWTPWDIPGNRLSFGSSTGTALLQTPLTPTNPAQYFRARLIEP